MPTGVTTRANAHVTNGAGYVQENLSCSTGACMLGGGLRFDAVPLRRARTASIPRRAERRSAGRWQPKGSVAFTPSQRVPLTLHANYGRGISTLDARGVVQ